MGGCLLVYFFLLFCQFLIVPSSSLPLCTDLRGPVTQQAHLGFCSSYNGSGGGVCCDSTKDGQLEKQLQGMNISDTACADLVKSTLCAQCDPFSAELYKIETDDVRSVVPVLCNSSAPPSNLSPSSKESTTSNSSSFCSTLWTICQNVSISNSPFAPSLQGRAGGGVPLNSSASTLSELWQSQSAFCNAFGGVGISIPSNSASSSSFCFEGKPVSLHKTAQPVIPPKGLCLEKIDNGSYINMVAHPDGSDSAFFSEQPGKIFLATVPEQGSGGTLGLDESTPFMDLTDIVHSEASLGMMGMAFHPGFPQNGRFFASFNCDKVLTSGCSGRCACNLDASCDPSNLASSAQEQPCRYHSVVAEYSANGTSSGPSSAKSAADVEVRRIFTMGLPSTNNHGGQILFGPTDGYMYLMMGDGGIKEDPFNFSQNKKSLLGKIMRLDVDNIPSAAEIDNQGLWGNYSIPPDNPYSGDVESLPEIWALGLRNPWRCSFDAERPLYFLCGDAGENRYEEVDVIIKGNNYGWSLYEGPIPFKLNQSSGKNTSFDPRNITFPVLGYTHSDINKKEGSASISAGYIYRSTTDQCLYGSYLYADLYATGLWAAAETSEGSGNFTPSMIPFSCAHDSPIKCSSIPGSTLPALGYIFSFGQDNRKDVFILTSSGVYRVIRPSRCNYTCSKETVAPSASPGPGPGRPPSASSSHRTTQLTQRYKGLLVHVLSSLLFLLGI